MTKVNKNYWFKRRRYGYGWTPVTWQGWAVIGCFVAVVLGGAFVGSQNEESDLALWLYLNFVFAAALLLIGVSLQKGPMPHWRWGKSDGDNPDEDF